MTTRHAGQQALPSIAHHHGIYTIDNLRDFRWIDEHSPRTADYLTGEIAIDDIKEVVLYQSLFGVLPQFPRMFAHYMLGFVVQKGDRTHEIVVSIEARRPFGGRYTLRKWLFPNKYGQIIIRGTPDDLIRLRTDVWHEPVVRLPLKLTQMETHDVFRYIARITNRLISHPHGYSALTNNCITDMHSCLYRACGRLPRFALATLWPTRYVKMLQKHGLLA